MSQETSHYEGIIVLGMPRSGTTLLRRILNAHPNICCPPETNLLSGAARFLEEHQFSGGHSVGVVNALAFSGFAEEEVYARLREFVTGFFREICRREGKPRWAEKTAFDAFHLDEIEKLMGPHCRYIGLFRHPLDVVCSLKDLCNKMDTYLPEIHDYIRRYRSPLEAFAHAWADVNGRLVRFADDHPDWCVSCRYEQLVDDPVGETTRILEFLGEPAVDTATLVKGSMERPGSMGLGDWRTYETRHVSKKSVDRWKDLSEQVAARLGEIVNPVMQSVGYEPIPAAQQPQAEDARHRYQLGLMAAQMKAKQEPSDGPS